MLKSTLKLKLKKINFEIDDRIGQNVNAKMKITQILCYFENIQALDKDREKCSLSKALKDNYATKKSTAISSDNLKYTFVSIQSLLKNENSNFDSKDKDKHKEKDIKNEDSNIDPIENKIKDHQ